MIMIAHSIKIHPHIVRFAHLRKIEKQRKTDMSDSTVVIYGQTLFCMSLHGLLVEKLPNKPDARIVCVSSLSELLSLPTLPKVIFAERDGRDDIFHLPKSHRHTPILTLDTGSGELRINSQEMLTLDTMIDLVDVIMHFTSMSNPHAK